jgi:hypothetical protein
VTLSIIALSPHLVPGKQFHPPSKSSQMSGRIKNPKDPKPAEHPKRPKQPKRSNHMITAKLRIIQKYPKTAI